MTKKPEFSIRISMVEYRDLCIARDRIATIENALGIKSPISGKGGSKIYADQELVAFILATEKTHSKIETFRLCLAKFGSERTPTKTAFHRFIARSNGIRTYPKQRLKPFRKPV